MVVAEMRVAPIVRKSITMVVITVVARDASGVCRLREAERVQDLNGLAPLFGDNRRMVSAGKRGVDDQDAGTSHATVL